MMQRMGQASTCPTQKRGDTVAENVQWIKLIVGMFDGESFKKIKRARIGGEKFRDKLTAVWFELMDFAGKCNHHGAFINAREIPFVSMDDIAAMIDREPDELQLCMSFFVNEGMVEIVNDVYMLANWAKYQNTDGLDKIREQKRIAQAKWRAKKKALTAANGEENEIVDDDVEVRVDSTVDSFPLISNISTSTISNTLNSSNIEEGKKKESKKGGRKKAEAQQPPADFSGTTFSPAMIAKVEKWLQYKTERRDIYQPTGLQSLITKIQNNVNKYGEQAVAELIETCMASNWSGIIFDKLQPPPQQQPYYGVGHKSPPASGVDRLLNMIERGDFDE